MLVCGARISGEYLPARAWNPQRAVRRGPGRVPIWDRLIIAHAIFAIITRDRRRLLYVGWHSQNIIVGGVRMTCRFVNFSSNHLHADTADARFFKGGRVKRIDLPRPETVPVVVFDGSQGKGRAVASFQFL